MVKNAETRRGATGETTGGELGEALKVGVVWVVRRRRQTEPWGVLLRVRMSERIWSPTKSEVARRNPVSRTPSHEAQACGGTEAPAGSMRLASGSST